MIPKRTKRITSEWLNTVLHNAGYLKDVNIESISREPWGAGEGFVSDMARLTITYDKESSELPKTMIVKMPTTFRTALAIALQYNLYEKEIRFYTEAAPKSPIRVPEVIYSDIDSENKKYIPDDLKGGHFIVQEAIKQHPALNGFNPHSVNTIRIITFLTRDEEVEFLSAVLRTSSGYAPIDNFKSGGIVIGIDIPTGRLKQWGFFHPQYGTTATKHPVTHTEFHHFQIPYWGEVINLASRVQRVFHHLKVIGWDFAISTDGPLVIEGNVEWGTAGLQAANGGLLSERNKKLFSQYGLNL